jgi:choline dehydrogenase
MQAAWTAKADMLYRLILLAGLTSLSSSVPTPPFFGENLVGTSFGVPGQPAEYDYVIVGGGCAGLTLANRLAENNSISVAVIEAGTFYELSNGNLSEIPAMDVNYMGKDPHDWQPGVDWGFITAPQRVCLFSWHNILLLTSIH